MPASAPSGRPAQVTGPSVRRRWPSAPSRAR